MTVDYVPIGTVRSPFDEKFGIPRQAGLVPEVEGVLVLEPPYGSEAAVRELDRFSHIWVLFAFHAVAAASWRPTVRPPRLGGNRRVGVFATRSPFRPNPIGLSCCRLLGLAFDSGTARLRVRGLDLLDGTPILDIKPYVPYADSIPEAEAGFAAAPPPQDLPVTFAPEAARTARHLEADTHPRLMRQIRALLALDPRPAIHRDHPEPRFYGFRFAGLNVRWTVVDGTARVVDIGRPDAESNESPA